MTVAFKRQRGLSMLELMIASVMGVALLAGFLKVFSVIQDTDRTLRSISEIQDSGRTALRLIKEDVQMSAYQGCATGAHVTFNVIANDSPTDNLHATAIKGYEVTDEGWLSGNDRPTGGLPGTQRALLNSDVVTIHRASTLDLALTKAMSVASSPLEVENNSLKLKKDDLALIADCESVDLFRVSNDPGADGAIEIAHDTSANTSGNLRKAYGTQAKVMRFIANTYFVGETGRRDDNGHAITALYRRSTKGDVVELMEGIENLQILYGARSGNGRLRYLPADAASLKWERVESVKISFLIAGSDEVLKDSDKNIYQLAGQEIKPARSAGVEATYTTNKKLRKAFSSTIYMRNKSRLF